MSDEQLVRMGRTDLYRRGDTEIKDGRVVAKPGETAVTVLTTTLSGPFSCAHERRGVIGLTRPDGKAFSDGLESNLDLIELSPAPKLVPWEFAEIPAKNWFRKKGDSAAYPIESVNALYETVCINGDCENIFDLKSDYEHSASHAGPFEPCGKVV